MRWIFLIPIACHPLDLVDRPPNVVGGAPELELVDDRAFAEASIRIAADPPPRPEDRAEVFFGNVPSPEVSVSRGRFVATVPLGAPSGPLEVRGEGWTAEVGDFTYLGKGHIEAPSVRAISATTAPGRAAVAGGVAFVTLAGLESIVAVRLLDRRPVEVPPHARIRGDPAGLGDTLAYLADAGRTLVVLDVVDDVRDTTMSLRCSISIDPPGRVVSLFDPDRAVVLVDHGLLRADLSAPCAIGASVSLGVDPTGAVDDLIFAASEQMVLRIDRATLAERGRAALTGSPIAAVRAPSGSFAVVEEGTAVVLLDGTTLARGTRTPLSGVLDLAAGGGRLYALTDRRTVSALDAVSLSISSAHPVDGDPSHLASSGELLLASDGSGELAGLSSAVLEIWRAPLRPPVQSLDARGALFMTLRGLSSVYELDENRLVAVHPLDGLSLGVAASPFGTVALIENETSISLVDVGTGGARLTAETDAALLAGGGDSVAVALGSRVTRLDGDGTLETFDLPEAPASLSGFSDGTFAAALGSAMAVAILSPGQLPRLERIEGSPERVAMGPGRAAASEGRRLWLIGSAAPAFVELPEAPDHLAFSPDGRVVYAAMASIGAIARVDFLEARIADAITDLDAPAQIVTSPDGATLFVGGAAASVYVAR